MRVAAPRPAPLRRNLPGLAAHVLCQVVRHGYLDCRCRHADLLMDNDAAGGDRAAAGGDGPVAAAVGAVIRSAKDSREDPHEDQAQCRQTCAYDADVGLDCGPPGDVPLAPGWVE